MAINPILNRTLSRKRNRQLIAEFANEIIAKNDKGIASHGGGLDKKDTTAEIGDEIKDLVNYWVEHRKQVGELVAASLAMWQCFRPIDDPERGVDSDLKAALAPFVNKSKKGND